MMKPTTIYLIRHGQTDENKNEIIQGWLNSTLNEHGRRQARAMAERFRTVRLDYIYTSPLDRAHETARILASVCQATLAAEDLLKEINMGALTGLRGREVDEMRSHDFPHLGPQYFSPPGGETTEELYERGKLVLHTVLARMRHKQVALVSHGGTISALVTAALRMPPHARHGMGVHNTSISKLTHVDGHWRLKLFNDHAHLAMIGEDTL